MDENKLRLIEEYQEELLRQRSRVLRVFIPDSPKAVPFQAQINFFKDKSLSRLCRCGNRAAKTFSTMRDLAWKITRTHPYNSNYCVFNPNDSKLYDKIDSPEFELRYMKEKPRNHWIVGPTFDFVKETMWGKYLDKMIPAWFIKEIKYTNQKNIDSVIFKNGDVLKCKTYSQQETTKMGFVVDNIVIDELPNDAQAITELLVRTFDCDGSLTMGFTPLVENEDIRQYLDKSCAIGTCVLHSWTIYDNPHYRDNKERLTRVLAEYSNLSENERNSRLGGEWYFNKPDKAVFEGMEPELVEDFEVPLHWRRVRVTDPASHVTGHAEFAEDPLDGQWYCYKAVEFNWGHIVKASDIVQEIEKLKPYPTFKYESSIYDSAEGWFGAESKHLGYRSCLLKNREAAIMNTRDIIGSGKLKFFRRGADLALKQFRAYKYGNEGKVVRKNDHALDCVMYFSREIPRPLASTLPQHSITKEAILGVIAKAESTKKKQISYSPYKQRIGIGNFRQRGLR